MSVLEMFSDVALYLLVPGRDPVPAGRLRLTGPDGKVDTIDDVRYVVLEVDYFPPQAPAMLWQTTAQKAAQPLPLRWVTFRIETTGNQTQLPVGHLLFDQNGMPGLSTAHAGPGQWYWRLNRRDLETGDEEIRYSKDAIQPMRLAVRLEGLVSSVPPVRGVAPDVVAIRGTGTLTVEPTQWQRVVEALGDPVPPAQADLVDASSLGHPAWDEARRALSTARSDYRLGDDYDALRQCLSALESIVPSPYDPSQWLRRMTAAPRQKAEGVAALLAGLATFCNRIGHHRDRDLRDEHGSLPPMPVDHWEVGLLLGASQFLLTYAKRLSVSGDIVDP